MKRNSLKAVLAVAALIIMAGIGLVSRNSKPEVLPPTNEQNQILTKSSASAAEGETTSASTDTLTINPAAPLPRLFISGGKEGYSSGGLISLTSTEEPAVDITSYNLSGEATITVYQADMPALLEYLTHDKNGKQTTTKTNTENFRKITSFKQKVDQNQNNTSKAVLPIGQSGIWYLDVSINNVKDRAFIIRSENGAVIKQGDGTYLYWVQNFKSRRSVKDAKITLYNLVGGVKTLDSVQTDNNGIAQTKFDDTADIAVIESGTDTAILPINLRYLNDRYTYKPFQVQKSHSKFFLFTDRPLYRPGDTLYFKSIIRDDYDGSYSIPNGAYRIRIFKDWNETESIFDKTINAKNGTLTGDFILPKDIATGSYQMKISLPGTNGTPDWLSENYVQFRVENFRKPEYSIDIKSTSLELVPGDTVPITVSGEYFFGAPLANQKVKYSVYTSDYYDYGYWDPSITLNDDYRYGYWNGTKTGEQELTLNDRGEAIITLDTGIAKERQKTQVYSLEAETIDASGNPAFARKNIIVYAGEYGIYREGYSVSGTPGKPLELPVAIKEHRASNIKNVPLKASIHRSQWIAYTEPGAKYPSYREESEDLPPVNATTNAEGKAVFSMTPKKAGSYIWTIEGQDSKGNTIRNEFYTWVSSELDPYYSFDGQNGNLSLKTVKAKYEPGETVALSINSTVPDRDILVSLQRGFVHRFQVVKMFGKNAKVNLATTASDIPNIIAVANSFSSGQFDRGSQDITISGAQKKLDVVLTPDKSSYGPGENVTLHVDTKDGTGKPVSADVAVWAVDKSIFELADNNLGKIYDTYWSTRYDQTVENNSLSGIITEGGAEQGGCFASGTKITMANGDTKNIEDVKVGDKILSKNQNDPTGKARPAGVTATHQTEVTGYIIVNTSLKVTPNHILFINGKWQQAGNLQIGDTIYDESGRPIAVTSIEWQAGKFTVYNLTIENTHTFFANGVLAHNDKGGNSGRSVFKDTAYWNPKVATDNKGQATVTFKLPDNLTTWVLAGVGQTLDTIVGQTEKEITVSKDIIVRPILPNILRVGDKIKLSALVHNFTEENRTFRVRLEFDAGSISAAEQTTTIRAKGFEQLYWDVSPNKVTAAGKIKVSATDTTTPELHDIISQNIPVKALGFTDTKIETGTNDTSYTIALAKDTDSNQSTVAIALSPSLIGTIPEAMKYLIDYPYGCVEQTTSRFVPAILARKYKTLFPEALQDKNIDEIINQGISRLMELQQPQGGWQWWSYGESNYFITAYVVEYLLEAQKLGYRINTHVLANAKSFLEAEIVAPTSPATDPIPANNSSDALVVSKISRAYALSLLGSTVARAPITNFQGATPDVIAMAAITNERNGFIEARNQAVQTLRDQKKIAGETTFWDAGQGIYFGTNDSSTAWAIRALLLTKQDTALVDSSLRYLTSNRKTNYWSNTFATAQVIRAVSDATSTKNLTASSSYTVRLNGQVLKAGIFSKLTDTATILLPNDVLAKKDSLKLEVLSNKTPIYSTLTINEFRTDMDAAPTSHGITISREYTNNKGANIPIGVGDTVTVKLTLSGLASPQNYGIIEDWLPSGLIPINQTLKNEQYTEGDAGYQGYDYWGHMIQITENGAIIPTYAIPNGTSEFTYQARAVAEGEFSAPPAFASLMYHPEIYSRSETSKVTILKQSGTATNPLSQLLSSKHELTTTGKIFAIAILGVIAGGFYIIRKRKTNNTITQVTEDENKPE